MATRKAVNHTECPFKDYVVPPQQSTSEQKMEVRVGRLEGVVETLATDMQEMARNVTGLGKEIGSLRDTLAEKIDMVSTRITDRGKPNMQGVAIVATVVIALFGLGASVVSLISSGQSAAIAEAKSEIKVLTTQLFQDQFAKGVATQAAADHQMLLKATEDRVNRELSLVSDQVLDLRKWRLDYASENGEFQGRVATKQQIIEDRLKLMEQRLMDRLLMFEKNAVDETFKRGMP